MRELKFGNIVYLSILFGMNLIVEGEMENMRSFWQLSDELRGQNKGAEDHKWSMAATKLADQSWAKGERFHNLDLSKAPAVGRTRENMYHEGSKFENLNFNMLNLDSNYTESVNKSLFMNGYDNVNVPYQKSSGNSFGNGNFNASKYGGANPKEAHKKNNNENSPNSVDEKRFKTLPAAEMLPRDEVLGGYIFVCNNDTMQDDLKRLLFGISSFLAIIYKQNNVFTQMGSLNCDVYCVAVFLIL